MRWSKRGRRRKYPPKPTPDPKKVERNRIEAELRVALPDAGAGRDEPWLVFEGAESPDGRYGLNLGFAETSRGLGGDLPEFPRAGSAKV